MEQTVTNKKFNFIIQAKGGVGKSFLTYLIAMHSRWFGTTMPRD
jgi:hypothetical protein